MTRLQPGDPAPDFALTSQDGSTVSLGDFSGRGVVIFFYPAALTPGCTKEACDFRDTRGVWSASGYDVVGISPDRPDKLARFAETHGLPYPLLSDPDKTTLEAYGAYGEKNSYGKVVVGVIRSTIVVGPDGRVETARYNVRATGHVASLAKGMGIPLD